MEKYEEIKKKFANIINFLKLDNSVHFADKEKMANYAKPDFWALKAQKEGYPARSVYKLKEIDEKFLFLKGEKGKILDLGAAPGSWSLYVLRLMKEKNLTAVDLAPLSRRYDNGLFDVENFRFLQGDMTSPDIREALSVIAPFQTVLCDAAPATTGNNMIDAIRSLELSETAFEYAAAFLGEGGDFAVKVFQGGDCASLFKKMKETFTRCKAFKPSVCRKESFETYYIGLGRK